MRKNCVLGGIKEFFRVFYCNAFVLKWLEYYLLCIILADQARQDVSLLDMVAALIETEYIPRKERAIKSRLKLSAIPVKKRLEDFDLGWLKGGLTAAKFAELKTLAFIERKENVLLLGPSGLGKEPSKILCKREFS